jgi:energy-converting hydrogenase Eha subunit E
MIFIAVELFRVSTFEIFLCHGDGAGLLAASCLDLVGCVQVSRVHVSVPGVKLINFYAISITIQMIFVQFNVTLVHFSTATASNFLICLRVPIIAEWVVAIPLGSPFVPGRT